LGWRIQLNWKHTFRRGLWPASSPGELPADDAAIVSNNNAVQVNLSAFYTVKKQLKKNAFSSHLWHSQRMA
jgi:hypothetical protein